MADKDTKDPNRYRYNFKGGAKGYDTLLRDMYSDITDASHPAWFFDRLEVEFAAFYRFDCVGVSSHLQALASRGFTNPSEILWEKIPFSFVVDWVLPIGEYLNTIDSGLGWEVLAGTLSKRLTAKGQSWVTSRPSSGWSKLSVTGSDKRFFKSLYRSTLDDVPFPRLLPKNPLSLTHVANSVALLSGAVGR
jgi:hypothetical protein